MISRVPVLIVGAGPVGLALAGDLGDREPTDAGALIDAVRGEQISVKQQQEGVS